MARIEQIVASVGTLSQHLATTSADALNRVTAEATSAKDLAARAELVANESSTRIDRLYDMCVQQNNLVEARFQAVEKKADLV